MVKNLSALFLFSFSCASLAGTGFLQGEEISGLNKICYYRGASGTFAITQRAASVCRPSADDGRGSSAGLQRQRSSGGTGFLQGEEINGLNKICYYRGASGRFAITQRAASVCRPSAQNPR